MNDPYDILELFFNNPSKEFSVSDVMRAARVCWVSAKDYMVMLKSKGWIVKKKNGWVFNENKTIVRNS